jgi:hypothetical protein
MRVPSVSGTIKPGVVSGNKHKIAMDLAGYFGGNPNPPLMKRGPDVKDELKRLPLQLLSSKPKPDLTLSIRPTIPPTYLRGMQVQSTEVFPR